MTFNPEIITFNDSILTSNGKILVWRYVSAADLIYTVFNPKEFSSENTLPNQLTFFNYLSNLYQMTNYLFESVPTTPYILEVQKYLKILKGFTPIVPVAYPPIDYGILLPPVPTNPSPQDTYAYQLALTAQEAYNFYILFTQKPLQESLPTLKTQEIIDYYLNLLIVQYHDIYENQLTTYSTVAPTTQNILMGQVLNSSYNLFSCVGSQQDTLGEYLNVNRNFVWFDESNTKHTQLTDNQFRIVLLMASVFNNTNNTDGGIDEGLQQVFGTAIYISSSNNMNETLFVTCATFDIIVALKACIYFKIIPKPTGVGLISIIAQKKPAFSLQKASSVPIIGRLSALGSLTNPYAGMQTNYNDSLTGYTLSNKNFL